MGSLARFVMRGYSQAALVASGFAVLSLLFPLLGLLSSAAVALITLRRGPRPGLLLLVLATLGTGVLALLAMRQPWPALGVLIAFWLPTWALAATLRWTRSLGWTLQAAGGAALLLVLVVHLSLADPAAAWLTWLEPVRAELVREGLLQATAADEVFTALASWMTGAFAAALLLQLVLSLFIARSWQARLYNPGGFGAEFRELRLHPLVGLVFVALLLAAWLFPAAGLITDLLPALVVLLILQGLAVVHGVSWLLKVKRGWLIALYVLLLVVMLQVVILLTGIGLVDFWANFRARVARRVEPPK